MTSTTENVVLETPEPEDTGRVSTRKKGKEKQTSTAGPSSSKSTRDRRDRSAHVSPEPEILAPDSQGEETEETGGPPTKPPQMFECMLYGDLTFLNEAGPYGNWVPDGEPRGSKQFAPTDHSKASVVINMEVEPQIAKCLQIIDDAMITYLQEFDISDPKYNHIVKNNMVAMKYPLLVPQHKWLDAQDSQQGNSIFPLKPSSFTYLFKHILQYPSRRGRTPILKTLTRS